MCGRFSIYLLAGAIIVALAAISAVGEPFWDKRDWKEWNREDCSRMLQNSPWAKKWAQSVVNLSSGSLPGRSGPATAGSADEIRPEVDYFIQIRSALPIREADVRRIQLDKKYDHMDAEQKKVLDAEGEKILEPTYDDVILIHVDYGSNIVPYERALASYFQSIPDGSVPVGVYLINERGDHVGVAKWVSTRSGDYEFEMYFPRNLKGEPVIHDSDKKFSIEFPAPAVGSQMGTSSNARDTGTARLSKQLVLVEFTLSAMKWKGHVTF